MSTTKLVTKKEALDMLSTILREVNDPDVMCDALDTYARIAGWYKREAKRKRKAAN